MDTGESGGYWQDFRYTDRVGQAQSLYAGGTLALCLRVYL